MKVDKVFMIGVIALLSSVSMAQEFPRAEIGVDYSYLRYAPSLHYSQGHNLNGGGGSIVFNWNEYLGIRADLQGYTNSRTGFNIPPTTTFPNGLQGNVQGNLFSYLFGPQLKVRAHRVQPFGNLLFGGAHTNLYGNAFTQLCQPIVGGCKVTKAPTAEAFAMSFGGGVDIPIGQRISIRPAEISYFLTRFSNPFVKTNNQNNFRYMLGVNFNLSHSSY